MHEPDSSPHNHMYLMHEPDSHNDPGRWLHAMEGQFMHHIDIQTPSMIDAKSTSISQCCTSELVKA